MPNAEITAVASTNYRVSISAAGGEPAWCKVDCSGIATGALLSLLIADIDDPDSVLVVSSDKLEMGDRTDWGRTGISAKAYPPFGACGADATTVINAYDTGEAYSANMYLTVIGGKRNDARFLLALKSVF